MLKIEQARINEHFADIVKIARQHYFTEQDGRTNGFYHYFPGGEHLVRMIENNPLCGVVLDDDELIAFLTAADDQRIADVAKWGDDDILRQILEFKPLIYAEQIALKYPKTRKGASSLGMIASRLNSQAEERGLPIYALVVESPWRNVDSERFVKNQGYERVGEIDSWEEGRLGIYRKNK